MRNISKCLGQILSLTSLIALNASGANIIGNNTDVTYNPLGLLPVFTPNFGPAASGTNTVLPFSIYAKGNKNGWYINNLVGGPYTVVFGSDTTQFSVIVPSDTNTYWFNDIVTNGLINLNGYTGPGVSQLVAGPNVTLTPASGLGVVIISASGGGGGGGTTIITNINSLQAINALSFGAKGDNTSDNTAAINAAIAYSIAQGYNRVYLPGSNYRCNILLTNRMEIIGDSSAYETVTLAPFDTTKPTLQIGNDTAQVKGINLHRVSISGLGSSGVSCPAALSLGGGALESTFDSCMFRFGTNVVRVQGGTNYPASLINFFGCKIDMGLVNVPTGRGVYIASPVASGAGYTTAVRFDGCHIQGNTYGYAVEVSNSLLYASSMTYVDSYSNHCFLSTSGGRLSGDFVLDIGTGGSGQITSDSANSNLLSYVTGRTPGIWGVQLTNGTSAWADGFSPYALETAFEAQDLFVSRQIFFTDTNGFRISQLYGLGGNTYLTAKANIIWQAAGGNNIYFETSTNPVGTFNFGNILNLNDNCVTITNNTGDIYMRGSLYSSGVINGNGKGLTYLSDVAPTTSHNYQNLIFRGIDTFGDSWNGSAYISTEALVLNEMTNILYKTPLFQYGYNVIHVQDGWWAGRDTNSGVLLCASNNFPHGIAWLANVLHTNGILLYLYYDDKPTNTTAGPYLHPFGVNALGQDNGIISQTMYSNDVYTFKQWGVNGVSWDNRMGGSGGTIYGDDTVRDHDENWSWWFKHLAPEICFGVFGSSLTNYDWVISTPPGVTNVARSFGWPKSVTNAWHGNTISGQAHKLPPWRANVADICYFFMDGWAGQNEMDNVREEIAWMELSSPYVGRGHSMSYAMPMNPGQTIWDLTKPGGNNGKVFMFPLLFHSPILFGGNVAAAYPQEWPFLTNSCLLNIQRDSLQAPPQRVWANADGGITGWYEKLSDGTTAVALYSASNNYSGYQTVSFPLASAGISSNAIIKATDVFFRTNCFPTNCMLTTILTNYDCQLFIISPYTQPLTTQFVFDDFMFGSTTNIGSLNWRLFGTPAFITDTSVAGFPNHPGIQSITTGTVSNSPAYIWQGGDGLMGGVLFSSGGSIYNNFISKFIFRILNTNNCAGAIGFKGAMPDNFMGSQIVGTYCWFSSTNAGNYFQFVSKGGGETRVNSTIQMETNNFHVLTIDNTQSPYTVYFSLDGEAPIAVSRTAGERTIASPVFSILTGDTTAKTLWIDYWDITYSGLNRYQP